MATGSAHQEWPAIQAMVYFDYDMTFAGQPDWRLIQPGDGSAFRAYQALAADPQFRASMPPRPKPGAGRWRLMPTAKQVADDAITHIVAQDGSGEFATIGAALAAAGEGYTILVRPGTYDESLVIDKGVTIVGDTRRGPVVIQPSTAAAFTLAGSTATLADLTLRGPLGTVNILGGAPTLRGLRFEAVGLPTDVTPGLPAISVIGGSSAVLIGNAITGGAIGISVSEGTPTLEDNTHQRQRHRPAGRVPAGLRRLRATASAATLPMSSCSRAPQRPTGPSTPPAPDPALHRGVPRHSREPRDSGAPACTGRRREPGSPGAGDRPTVDWRPRIVRSSATAGP